MHIFCNRHKCQLLLATLQSQGNNLRVKNTAFLDSKLPGREGPVLAALPEDPGKIPSVHICPILAFMSTMHAYGAQKYMQRARTHTHTQIHFKNLVQSGGGGTCL